MIPTVEKLKEDIHDKYRTISYIKRYLDLENTSEYYLLQERLASLEVNSPEIFFRKIRLSLSLRFPSKFFRDCLKNGQLERFFPELVATVGCTQDTRYHTDDVFDHTMLALDYIVEHTTDISTCLAVLFHDIGKPVCRKELTRS
jgi:hypothetical protein